MASTIGVGAHKRNRTCTNGSPLGQDRKNTEGSGHVRDREDQRIHSLEKQNPGFLS